MKRCSILCDIIVIIAIIICSVFNTNVYATSKSEKLEFEKATYMLRGEHEAKLINISIPNNYTIDDVEITSENEQIVRVLKLWGEYYIESLKPGETRIKATIKSTNYIAYSKVKVEEPIIINVVKKDVGATLEIDSYCPYVWSRMTSQACEILITPLSGDQNEKWIRLGEGVGGSALSKKYSYDITENCIATVRWISWWENNAYDGENEIFQKSIVVDDLKNPVSIGARIKVYGDNKEESSSIMNPEDTLKLNVQMIEIPTESSITWKSYQNNVATVSEDGTVTAIAEGTARIEATVTDEMADGTTMTYVDVYPIIVKRDGVMQVEQILENNGALSGDIPDTITIGGTKQAIIQGDGFNISWSSGDDKIASVTKDGVIQGVTNGKTTIKADVSYNNKTYQVEQEIIVTGEKQDTDNKDNNTDNNTDNNIVLDTEENNINNEDTTTANTPIPQTGQSDIVMIVALIFSIVCAVLYVKSKRD